MNRIRVLIIMLLSISGCDNNDFETAYNFSGNGKLFSLDFGEDGQSKIGIYDTSGALEREITEDNGHARFGKFIGQNFFYVVNNADFTSSRVMKCSPDFECSVFYSTNGIISCLLQFADRLNFYYETPKDDANSINYQTGFRIISVDFSGKNPQVRYNDHFYYTVCPVELGRQVLISAIFQGRSDFIFKDNIAIIREDYKREEFLDEYKLSRSELDIYRGIYVILSDSENIAYIGINKGRGYIFNMCLSINYCDFDEQSSPPLFIGNRYYTAQSTGSKHKIIINEGNIKEGK